MKAKLFVGLACAALLLIPAAQAGTDCNSHIEAGLKSLISVRDDAKKLTEEQRRKVENFLADAEKLLASARRECNDARTDLDKATAAGKALIAQGNVAAAQLLLKAY